MLGLGCILGGMNTKMKPFKKGFIVGKFCPLHKGHQFLIETGIQLSQELMILSYTSTDFKNCEPEKRYRWITTLYPEEKVIVIPSSDCPLDSDEADIHRLFCGNVMKENDYIPDVIFTSEKYGEPFSNFISKMMGITASHYLVDIERNRYQISGTKLRENFNPDFCDAVVVKDFKND